MYGMIEIREATKSQAAEIACLIMTATTDECCLYFCGDGYGLEDFRNMMTMLVEAEVSQYSYKNTMVAMDADKVVGISVSYDGGRLHELRRAFIEAAKEHIGKDHTAGDDCGDTIGLRLGQCHGAAGYVAAATGVGRLHGHLPAVQAQSHE